MVNLEIVIEARKKLESGKEVDDKEACQETLAKALHERPFTSGRTEALAFLISASSSKDDKLRDNALRVAEKLFIKDEDILHPSTLRIIMDIRHNLLDLKESKTIPAKRINSEIGRMSKLLRSENYTSRP